ncbi:uncharacterized protein F4817DRAFT_369643 [Daldinia loculata]|uniref:uncharacterized protein n=1 Tax=Daldinia loculata TaxID=103429 RepID=UPI0020C5B114|nr:uncharacterized protein F4817DRAFT_369643 [Daldinia loculata]KAI1642158.1 hypothetical protein F4817DRAFT_369643 [Daldinia loculata]
MTGPMPPYALFVLVDDIDADYLNDALTRAYKRNFEAAWEHKYLVIGGYENAPKKLENAYPEGTKAPIHADFRSLFIGNTPEECALSLQNAPEVVALNREYFLFVDQFSKEEDTIQICRVEQNIGTKRLHVEYFPKPTGDSTVRIATSSGLKFDEALQRYQRNRIRDGRPDRSKGVPYGQA